MEGVLRCMFLLLSLHWLLDRPNVFCRRIALLLLLSIDRRVFTMTTMAEESVRGSILVIMQKHLPLRLLLNPGRRTWGRQQAHQRVRKWVLIVNDN